MTIISTSEKPIYLDSSVSVSERAKDLVDRLTLEEKVGLMSHCNQKVCPG